MASVDTRNTNGFEAEGEVADMGLPYLTSFLWCMSLKVGSRLISVGHCLFSVGVVVSCLLMAHDASQYLGGEEDADGVYSRAFYTTLVIAVVSVVHVLLSCLLFFGVFWRRAGLVRLWVVVMAVLYAAGVVFLLVSALVYGLSATGSDIFVSFLQALVVFAFIGYCILCVYSYYLMLRSAEDLERPNKTDY